MKIQEMNVDIMGATILASTDGLVCLSDLLRAGNAWRVMRGMSALQLNNFVTSPTTAAYVEAASRLWELPQESFLTVKGRGRNSRTWGHISVAVLLAEQMSPDFHAMVHKTFIEGKLLEFRNMGGDEFKALNRAIDKHLPASEGKTNLGKYINTAKMIKERCQLPEEHGWNDTQANAATTQMRYNLENKMVDYLEQGFVRDWEHFKEILVRQPQAAF
jgi:hypothetical protein